MEIFEGVDAGDVVQVLDLSTGAHIFSHRRNLKISAINREFMELINTDTLPPHHTTSSAYRKMRIRRSGVVAVEYKEPLPELSDRPS